MSRELRRPVPSRRSKSVDTYDYGSRNYIGARTIDMDFSERAESVGELLDHKLPWLVAAAIV